MAMGRRPRILADDFLLETDEDQEQGGRELSDAGLFEFHVDVLDYTHAYLGRPGGRVAPAKSANLAGSPARRRLLKRH